METTQKRVTLSGNEIKALSTLDKTENGSTRVDTSASAVPMNMSKPNKTRIEKFPLTPPDEKRSVSFDLSINTLGTYDSFLTEFANSPAESIDISVRDCSEEICVSLKERDIEMKDLVNCNKDFFDTIKQSMFEDEKKWEGFLKVLYSKREVIPDLKWMESISEFLSDNPQFLSMFKGITGYFENDNDDDDDDFQEENDDCCHTHMTNEPDYVDITPIRNFPHVLENLEKSYPQFFINAKNELGNLSKERSRRGSTLGRNHLSNDNPLLHPNVEDDDQSSDQSSNDSSNSPSESLYDELKRLLITPRSDMDDNEWETAIYECIDSWESLTIQLEDIIDQEIRQNI